MTSGSLRLRLLAGGAAFIVAALALAALGLSLLFKSHAERWLDVQLTASLDRLISGLDVGPDGGIVLARSPDDPRFRQPLSGLYWQVFVEPDGPVLRSRSLWDFELELPSEAAVDDAVHHHLVAGPAGQTLYLLQRRVALPARLGGGTVEAAVALNDAEVRAAVWRFARALLPYLGLLGGLLTVAAWLQVSFGLRPLARMREKLAAIGSGERRRLGGGFPNEVQPLATEIDGLLEAREAQIGKARARAADLAHGFKTPLQVLVADVARLKAKGEVAIAAEIDGIAGVMQRLVDRQLARARLGDASTEATANLHACCVSVVGVMRRTAQGEPLDWVVDVDTSLAARVDPADLTEALGNLVENAARHARGRVALAAATDAGNIVLTVCDDGPGMPSDQCESLRRRGARLDTSGSGAGLGLAIVGDIAEVWGGALDFENTQSGFCVRLMLPRAQTAGT
jgi:signal transduction histidine kinase